MVLLLLQQKFVKTFQNGVITNMAKILKNLSEQHYYYCSKNPQHLFENGIITARILENLSERYYCYCGKNPGKPFWTVLLLLLQEESWKAFQNGIITITARILKKLYYSKNPGRPFRTVLLLLQQESCKTFQNTSITVTARILENVSEHHKKQAMVTGVMVIEREGCCSYLWNCVGLK